MLLGIRNFILCVFGKIVDLFKNSDPQRLALLFLGREKLIREFLILQFKDLYITCTSSELLSLSAIFSLRLGSQTMISFTRISP